MNYTITKNENIVKSFENLQINESITLFGNVNFNYFLYSKNSEINLEFDTNGEFVKGNIFVLFYGSGQSLGKIKTKINHDNCEIKVFILSFLQDDNFVDVNGDVIIGPKLKLSQGHLLEKNIVLGKNVKIKATPRLDVYSQNVHATHGVSINKIDPESLFYMGNKGLDSVSSQNLLLKGYIDNILQYFDVSSEEKQNIQLKILSTINITNG